MGFASMFENIEEKLLANALEAARAKRLVESDLARLEDSLRSAIDRVVTPLMEVLTEPQVDLAREILELRECKLSLARDLEVVGRTTSDWNVSWRRLIGITDSLRKLSLS